MKNDILDKLIETGFKEYEAKVFLSLLRGRVMSVPDIAKDSKVIRNSIYEILRTFVKKGYCNEIKTDKILKYEIIKPEIILDKIKRDRKKLFESELQRLENIFNEIKPLYGTNEKAADIVNIELIKGYNQHREAKFIELLKNTKKEILYMVRLEFFSSDEIDDTAKRFINNGGTIKSVYELCDNFKIIRGNNLAKGSGEDLIRAVEYFEKSGEQVKLTNEKVPNMTIFDREIVMMNIADRSKERHKEADLIIRNKDYAESMVKVFETFWKSAYKLKEYKNKLN